MRVGLTYDLQTNPADWRQAEFDPPRTIETLCGALAELGHDVLRVGGAEALLRAGALLRDVDLVLNIAEGSHGRCREAWVPTVLELFDVPSVGSDALALCLGLDKVVTKQLAQASGVATPRWVAIRHPDELPDPLGLRFPVIVKPRDEGSGIGIDPGAVVCDARALKRRVRWLAQQLGPSILIEEFVAFGELTVCLIGNDPPTAYPAIQRPVDPISRLSCHVAQAPDPAWEAPLCLTKELEHRVGSMALTMFEVLGCRDMARVDFRVDEALQPWFLEINPLPSFDPEGSFGLLAACLQTSYANLIGRIIEAARARLERQGKLPTLSGARP